MASAKATLVFVKLNSLDFASIAIPVVIAYLCYEITGYVTDSNDLYWVHTKVTEFRYPSMRASNLDLLLIPTGDAFGQAIRATAFSRRGRLFTLLSWARFPLQIIAPLAAALAFEVYALVQHFAHFGGTHVVLWGSILMRGSAVACSRCVPSSPSVKGRSAQGAVGFVEHAG